ncbi:MAG: LysR family transcriptional regulator [Gammaproteobacteria bacterium]
MNIQLRHLRHASALAEARSYSGAARALHVSQPALSRSIQALETMVGARLFDRTPAGVTPTTMGRLLVEHARTVLSGLFDLERELRLALGLETGSLAVGTGPYASDISVGTACGRLAACHPGLKLDVRVGDWRFLTQLALAGEVDVAVAETSVAEQDDRLETEALPPHRGAFICRADHPLAAKPRLELKDALAFPLAASSLPERMEQLSPAIRVDTFDLIRSLVLESNALGLALTSQITDDLQAGRLVCLPVDAPWLHTKYGFIRLKNRTPSPAAVAFMDMVRSIEQEIADKDPRA